LEEAVQQAGIAAPPLYLQETISTSSEAKRLADRGAPGWTIVAAGHQTAGRGRMGRSWVSAPGKALQFSLLLRPQISPEEGPLAPLLAAAEMARACEDVAGVRVRSKWPNDLVAGGRKLGGILPEAKVSQSVLDHLILGIGVNVSMTDADFPGELAATATSLLLEGGTADPAALLARFVADFREAWHPDQPGYRDDVLRRYRRVCVTLGQRVRATTIKGQVVEGLASDLDDQGGLRVGNATVAFGEVAHLDERVG
jgi:BirA family transcriptional regulator, biotin operon repressor / biotin---[acetyl-CoA-carboxylase] ligase